ncbi:hypothetical protein J2T50_001381 [Streptococcus gallinaceus]|uniref:hypothetical protein n=1 Tax=Streptococcus gallinaceus TaxID=165758 RepID=UPI00209CAA89|nr:hypothetical protein [Streptococcus gallinaceus]MCP1639672.1 hypothetical protein [Streptococcus gallinaceus]MCP1770455.1 hypothetical protein [Streptococcus gallinaceus]
MTTDELLTKYTTEILREKKVSGKMEEKEILDILKEVRYTYPELFAFITDFINRKISIEEVEMFKKMSIDEQNQYISNYLEKRKCKN